MCGDGFFVRGGKIPLGMCKAKKAIRFGSSKTHESSSDNMQVLHDGRGSMDAAEGRPLDSLVSIDKVTNIDESLRVALDQVIDGHRAVCCEA